MNKEKTNLIKFRINLIGIEPIIWREFSVEDTITFEKLNKVIQITMGWKEQHSYLFEVKENVFLEPKGGFVMDGSNFSEETNLNTFLKKEGQRLFYVYDLGDDWMHEIIIEKISRNKHGEPTCFSGERNCPPENCGAIPGYEKLCKAMKKGKGNEYKNLLDWLEGIVYDAEYFDLIKINKKLKKMTKLKKKPEKKLSYGK